MHDKEHYRVYGKYLPWSVDEAGILNELVIAILFGWGAQASTYGNGFYFEWLSFIRWQIPSLNFTNVC